MRYKLYNYCLESMALPSVAATTSHSYNNLKFRSNNAGQMKTKDVF